MDPAEVEEEASEEREERVLSREDRTVAFTVATAGATAWAAALVLASSWATRSIRLPASRSVTYPAYVRHQVAVIT